ncbi:molybdopterin molybdotransferase MoeA [Hippea jasoniae]|uniref:molybdopterin molybdotransferase MoeA n=1 Tax=Hippea jasoniae TaxID=944479 RepID=UPI0005590706|nr:molybdopterin molybdotransferase MoeA [Hippea jasoniae]
MIEVREALELIEKNVSSIDRYEEIFLDSASDRVAFEDIKSPIDVPSFDRSAMDGYALCGSHKGYKIVQSVDDFKDGCCLRINTGNRLPDNCFAVAEVEIVKKDNGFIKLLRDVEARRNFTFKGVEIKKGDVIVKKGERISVRKLGLIAYVGLFKVKVFAKPTVALITTGDEVVFPFENKQDDSVYNTNYFIVSNLLKKWHADVLYLGHVTDNKELIKEKILRGFECADIVITTGGVSKGSRDFIKEAADELGVDILFDKTTVKPGKPAVFGVFDKKVFFGLPGWPAALFSVAYLYLKPLVLKMAGRKDYKTLLLECIADEDMHSRKGKFYLNRVFLDYIDGQFHAKLTGSQKTENFFTVAIGEGFAIVDEKEGDIPASSRLPLLIFDD